VKKEGEPNKGKAKRPESGKLRPVMDIPGPFGDEVKGAAGRALLGEILLYLGFNLPYGTINGL